MKDRLLICKKNNIVAFKSKETGEWYTGKIQFIYQPNTEYNQDSKTVISICLISAIAPQWGSDNEKTVYYYDDITNLIILE